MFMKWERYTITIILMFVSLCLRDSALGELRNGKQEALIPLMTWEKLTSGKLILLTCNIQLRGYYSSLTRLYMAPLHNHKCGV